MNAASTMRWLCREPPSTVRRKRDDTWIEPGTTTCDLRSGDARWLPTWSLSHLASTIRHCTTGTSVSSLRHSWRQYCQQRAAGPQRRPPASDSWWAAPAAAILVVVCCAGPLLLGAWSPPELVAGFRLT